MPVNEFEKQVQDRLDDFQVNPSASVWKKVEEQIRKKKRRRVIFFLLFPALLGLLGYSIYYFLPINQKTEVAQQQVEAKKTEPINKNSDVNDKDKSAAEPGEQTTISQPKEADETNRTTKKIITGKENSTSATIEPKDLPVNPSGADQKRKPVIKPAIVQKKTDPSITHNNVQDKQELTVIAGKPATANVVKDEPTKKAVQETNAQKGKSDATATKQNTITAKADSVKTDSVKAEDVVKADSNKEVIAKKKSGKPKIKWGVDFSAGITANQSEVFALGRAYDALYASPGTGASAGQPGVTIPPSDIKSGPAFRIGVIGELQVSKRSRFSAGLQYAYASNKIMTGSGFDTTLSLYQANNLYSTQVDMVYRGPHQENYTNSYHFVSMPLGYHWQINKSKKLPIQWNVGVSLNYLLGTNALVYTSSYGGIYYEDKNAFTKMHFNIGTGLSLRLQSKKGLEWVIGPELSFDTRKLLKDGYGKDQYLFFGGINTKLFFPQKKNK